MGWFQGLQRGMARFAADVTRMLTPGVATFGVAVSAGSELEAAEDYPAEQAMHSLADFPWVRIAVEAVSGDMAALPLIAKRRQNRAARRAKQAAELVDDPILDRLERPNPMTGGMLFRQQLAADWLVCRNAYIERQDYTLWRLHPAEVTVVLGPLGLPAYYRVRDNGAPKGYRDLPPDRVIHIRGISWASDSRAAYGSSVIRPLHDDLETERATKALSRRNARRGRPDMLLSPKEDLGIKEAQKVATAFEEALAKGAAAVALGGGITAIPLNWTARDMEWAEQSERTREAVLSLFEVPPARAGLTSANYGTQKQQMRTYWESIIRRSQHFSEAFSRIAGAGTVVEHDFSDVESLQVGYTERLMRVTQWVGMGATPLKAAQKEGFHDAPVPDYPLVDRFHSPRRPKREPDEPQGRRTDVAVLASTATAVPTEAAIHATMRAYLGAAAGRWEEAVVAMRGGASLQLLEAVEAGHLFGVLCGLGMPHLAARHLADDEASRTSGMAQVLAEVARDDDELGLAALDGFGDSRARRIAKAIHQDLVELSEEAA